MRASGMSLYLVSSVDPSNRSILQAVQIVQGVYYQRRLGGLLGPPQSTFWLETKPAVPFIGPSTI